MAMNIDPSYAIGHAIAQQIENGVALREVMYILNTHLMQTKGITIFQSNNIRNGVMLMKSRKHLFRHVSLAACVEFALKYEHEGN